MTPKAQSHTPTPWHIHRDSQPVPFKMGKTRYGKLEIWPEDQTHEKVAVILENGGVAKNDGIEIGKANAAFIVEACNSHDRLKEINAELVEACKRALTQVRNHPSNNSDELAEDIESAIHRAEKGE